MIRKLAKKLSTLENFIDDVVVEIKFFRGNFESGVEVLKNRGGLKIIQVTTDDAKILVKLLTTNKNFSRAETFQTENKTWKIFSAEEIFEFVEEVGDKNKIHRISNPVVPGLLILETLLKSKEFFLCEQLAMRFKDFITAGESLTLKKIDENNFEIKSGDTTKIFIGGKNFERFGHKGIN